MTAACRRERGISLPSGNRRRRLPPSATFEPAALCAGSASSSNVPIAKVRRAVLGAARGKICANALFSNRCRTGASRCIRRSHEGHKAVRDLRRSRNNHETEGMRV